MGKAFEIEYKYKKVEIHIIDFEGDVRNINGTPDLFSLSYNSNIKDKGQYILATEAEINIYEDDFFNIDELKTVGETDILIKYFEYDELVWQGFALPDFFQTGITKPKVLRIVATDRLGVLKDIVNTSVSNTPKEIIEECLLQTGLSLPVEIRNNNTYLETTTINRERIEGVSAYDVIRSFMVQFNSKIVQYKNKWWVVNKKLLEDGFFNQEIIDIDLVYLDGQREIKPTASDVSLYLEFGGAQKYPKNWNFDKWTSNVLNNWTSYNGFVQNKNSKVPIRYNSSYSLIYGQDTNINSLLSRNAFLSQLTDSNYINSPHIKSDEISMQFIEGVSELNFEIDFTSINDDRLALYMVLLIRIPNNNPAYDDYIAVGQDGRVVKAGTTNIDLTNVPVMRVQPAVDENQDRLTAIRTTAERSFKISAVEDLGLTRGVNAKIQVVLFGAEYNDGTSTSLIDIVLHSTKISFNDSETKGKGLIFKTKQGGDKFSKVRETETTLFSDKINQGVNGYFYNYKYDDTSITNLPKEYLLGMTRQMADMFCSARDFYSLGGKFKVNPLARYRCGNKYFVFVGGVSHRKNSEIDIEEIVSNSSLTRTDYIYTYFEDSKDNIKSIGTASGSGGAGGAGGGGGMTSSQLDMLTNLADWWKLDEENDAIYSEKSVYSLKGVSALGLGDDGGGGDGGSIDMLDSWANYTTAKANYYAPASLLVPFRSDTLSRLTSLESGSATSIVTTGSGNAVTSLTKSGSVITADKGLTFSLSTHTHTIAQITGLQGALDSKATQSDIDTAIDGIEIGGRNLLPAFTSDKWTIHHSVIVTDYKITFPKTAALSDAEIVINTEKNTNYILTFNTDYARCYIYKGSGGVLVPQTTSRYIKFNSGEENSIRILINTFSGNTQYERNIWDLKLEKGNKATDWSPAPEDQVSDWNETDVTSFSYIKNKPTQLSQFTDNIGVGTHIANKANPHAVTKAQVGLSNVDNTSDLLKPISTATQTALNGKLNLTGGTLSGNLIINGGVTSLSLIRTASYNVNILFEAVGGKVYAGKGRDSDFVIGSDLNLGSTSNQWMIVNSSGVTAPTFIGALTGNASSATNCSRSVVAGNGLTGGGQLTANRTITLGTPSNITTATTNSVTASSHTHNLALGGTASQYLNGATSLVTIPTITAGNGLSGGGQLTASRTLTLGTPSTLSKATTNSVAASSHTHAITTTTVGAANTIVATDASGAVRGNIIRIGGNWTLELSGTELVFKYNGVIKQRMLSSGTILATGGITALSTE